MQRSPSARELAVAAIVVACGGASTTASCKTPTEVTVELSSDLGYRSDMAVAVQIDREGVVEAAAPRVVTKTAWGAGGSIGTVVVVPSADDDAVVVRTVLAAGRDPTSCSAADSSGCIVARRRVHFTHGSSTEARVVLRPACLGVFCDARTSCAADGRCGSLDDDVAAGDASAPDAPLGDAGDPYANAVLEDRPRHYYRLGEPEGATVAKDAMGRADGTYASVKLGVTGGIKSSRDTGAFFDGAAAAVTIPKVDDLPGAFSVEAWARADTGGERPTIVERVDVVGGTLFGYRMSKPPGSSATFEVFRGAQAFSADARANKFAGYSHLVAVVRGGALEIWLDGSRADQRTLADTPASAVLGPLVIGGSRTGASAFAGAIDEVAIYDYPLDESQIRRHYDVAEKNGP